MVVPTVGPRRVVMTRPARWTSSSACMLTALPGGIARDSAVCVRHDVDRRFCMGSPSRRHGARLNRCVATVVHFNRPTASLNFALSAYLYLVDDHPRAVHRQDMSTSGRIHFSLFVVAPIMGPRRAVRTPPTRTTSSSAVPPIFLARRHRKLLCCSLMASRDSIAISASPMRCSS